LSPQLVTAGDHLITVARHFIASQPDEQTARSQVAGFIGGLQAAARGATTAIRARLSALID
jgi:hypothetical protein